MPTILHRIIKHPDLRVTRIIKPHKYRYIELHTYETNKLYMLLLILILKFIFMLILTVDTYFKYFVFSYSFSSKLTAINGKTSISLKGLWKRLKSYCKTELLPTLLVQYFFFFIIVVQLVSFLIHETNLINAVLSRHGHYLISLY